ncbi:hypothetical protein CVE34_15470 [Pseudomonas syringae pv. actinidiae]|nr:hypothetical protein IYO_029750 [Pseudomonas syringae pv. actinidiae ICMP 18884]AOE60199.1 hypothetical protein NZ708_29625 [Pseudomonas syringae pv. actinidiae ICMP 18708]APQ01166.1 hypothetical protein PsaNZ45_30175 [Pseudomonas syringae pv. actinidiae]AYL84396.1 hypothetical protein CN228_32720 [Pseudomonas syringae pv. actinidiae str. Shaanxi_M228]EPN82354.1 hypothetical protein A233_00085 [Pseudomonas syringae pv. actinidiae ICMP 19097]
MKVKHATAKLNFLELTSKVGWRKIPAITPEGEVDGDIALIDFINMCERLQMRHAVDASIVGDVCPAHLPLPLR